MEEELNENELEERFYSMLHYVDDTQVNVTTNQVATNIIENAPQSTLRRYWRPSADHTTATPLNTPFQKVNIPKEAPKPPVEQPKPKEETINHPVEPLPNYLSLFNSSVPEDFKQFIEILETDDNIVVELVSDDEDEVIEVALPPKPTITIESSDDEIPTLHDTPAKAKKRTAPQEKGSNNGEREISASPVPSVVSSVSDEFIRGDCIAFNISSRRPDNPSFDFSLHGADVLGSTPLKKNKEKKKRLRKNKKSATSTPITVGTTQNKTIVVEECFATPKNKARKRKQKNKSYVVTEKSVPNADVYDSDSNQSIIEINKNHKSYIVTEKSIPCVDLYETDSNPTEALTPSKPKATPANTSDSSISLDKSPEDISKTKKDTPQNTGVTIDLTDNVRKDDEIHENIVIGNVTGFTEPDDYDTEPITTKQTVPKFGSTKVPAILYENLDFDNLKGTEKVCKNRRYSLTSLRAEMEKFYNESWGGEDFNHREIQKNMSRDKSLWAIDPKDRMGSFTRKKYNVTCNYCNRTGHRDDTCRMKPPVCFMCGNAGHMEPRCPSKICVNCGSPNHIYSTLCRNCCNWGRVRCAECGQNGHPSSHCPDVWRRYHSTVDFTPYLEENRCTKKHYDMFCSGCTRRGHLVHACRISIPFSGLPINAPYVNLYRPVYSVPNTPVPHYNENIQKNQLQIKCSQDYTSSSATTPSRNDRNKRLSKSPTVHETHVSKKRMSVSEITEDPKSPIRQQSQRKTSQSKEPAEESDIAIKQQDVSPKAQSLETTEEAPDFIPIFSNNHNKKGQVIQDNEVSDTSDAITSARIYVTADIIKKLKTKEGDDWLKETTAKLQVFIDITENKCCLNIKGIVGDQEAFQSALRHWAQGKSSIEQTTPENEADTSVNQQTNDKHSFYSNNIPKNKNNAIRHLSKALKSLNENLGEPNELYKELTYLQDRYKNLINRKVVGPKQLENNRSYINTVLKKLNIVLLGQAGLAGGSKHVKELYAFQEKLVNHRTNNLTAEMRVDIGQHFHKIFTHMPRNDYEQLIQSYNIKNKKKPFNLNSKPKKFNTIPVQNTQKDQHVMEVKASPQESKPEVIRIEEANFKKPQAKITLNKLHFYHRRLLKVQPNDSVLKKKRVDLMRKLYSFINSLSMNPKTPAKNLKKMRKVQEQAQLFLNNV